MSLNRADIAARANDHPRPAIILTPDSDRTALVRWLQWADPNGCHTDEMAREECVSPYTLREAWEAVAGMLGDDPPAHCGCRSDWKLMNGVAKTLAELVLQARNLGELLDRWREHGAYCAVHGLDDWHSLDSTSLPTFGGTTPVDTIQIWSWDETHLLVGTCPADAAIEPRCWARPLTRTGTSTGTA